MAQTILPRKNNQENPIATDDDHHEALTNDASITQFPQSNPFGSSSGFGAPAPSPATPTINTSSQGSTQAMPQPNLTQAGDNAAQGAEVLVANDNTDFINKKWRPLMAFVYMITCTCDFVLFPVLWSLLQALSHGQVTSQWQPLTLQGAGLYHIAMGAVLGVAAYGRTKEKLEGKQ
jgi:hypothetical protein